MNSAISFSFSKLHVRYIHPKRVKILAGLLAPLINGEKGLDVGSGDGIISKLLSQKSKNNLRIDCVDVKTPFNEMRDDVILYDGKKLPFNNNEYDFILLIDVLHHLKDPFILLSEICRVAQKRIIIKDHLCENYFDFIRLKIMDLTGNEYRGIDSCHNYFSREMWYSFFKKYGLNLVSEITPVLYSFPFSIIASNKLQVIFVLEKAD